MGRWHGKIGYIVQTETAPDVWIPNVVERPKSGDVLKNRQQIVSGYGANPDVKITNQIEIVADPYDRTHVQDLRYLIWNGQYWTIDSVDLSEYPKLILILGGVWNGKRGTT